MTLRFVTSCRQGTAAAATCWLALLQLALVKNNIERFRSDCNWLLFCNGCSSSMSVFRLATSHAAPAARAAVQRPFPSTLSAPAVTHRGLCGQLAACAQAGGAGGVYSAFNLGTPLRPFCSNGSGAGGSKSGSSSNGASDLISKLAEPTFIANAVTAVALLYIASNLQEQKQKGDAATATATAAEFEERRLNAVKQRILEGNRNRMAAQETTRGQEGLSIVGRKADLAMLDQFVTIPGLYALVGDNG